VIEEVDAVVADLALRLGRIDLRQIRVVGGMAADFVAVGL